MWSLWTELFHRRVHFVEVMHWNLRWIFCNDLTGHHFFNEKSLCSETVFSFLSSFQKRKIYSFWSVLVGVIVSQVRPAGGRFKHGAILHNEAEVFSLSITNPNGRPMLPFDWLIHSSLILASCHRILFLCRFSAVEK